MPSRKFSNARITQAFEQAGGNQAAAARLLGMHVQAFRVRARKLGLKKGEKPKPEPVESLRSMAESYMRRKLVGDSLGPADVALLKELTKTPTGGNGEDASDERENTGKLKEAVN